MKKIGFILCFSLFLTACGSSFELELNTLEVSGTLNLNVKMQSVPALNAQYAYQEIPQEKDEALDSFLISSMETQLSLASYMQQELNQLRLQGYQISHEHTKKIKRMIYEEEKITVLKTYRIVNPFGKLLYLAQYGVPRGKGQLFLSYASDKQSNTKAFISSLSALDFNG